MGEISSATATLSVLLDPDRRKELQLHQTLLAGACALAGSESPDPRQEVCGDELGNLKRFAGTLADIVGQ